MIDTSQLLYLDTFSGISGDMFLGLLIDLGAKVEDLREHLRALDLPGWDISTRREKRQGIEGCRFIVQYQEQHHHRTWGDIRSLIERSQLEPGIRNCALNIFHRIARAEAKIHGISVDQVHFHEVGAIDSIIDVVASATGMALLGNPEVISTPLPFATGKVQCEHGNFPLPAPATLEILQGLPLTSSHLNVELVTPTGAAIVAELASFRNFPDMAIEKTGYGAGSRDIPGQPNLLRGILGRPLTPSLDKDRITVLETHVDDSNSEWLGALMEGLFKNGALDVSFSSLQMKKNRPGVKITVVCEPWRAQSLSRLLLRETSALGVRYYSTERYRMRRENRSFLSSLGEVEVKVVFEGDAILRISPEYECCHRISQQSDIPLPEVYRIVNQEADKLFRSQKN